MTEYEIYIEEINPCGGSTHARKSIIEAEAESPEDYVKEFGRFPILEINQKSNGDVVIHTGDGKGYFITYLFSC